MKRSRILALLAAGVLTVGSVGLALANTLSEDHLNQVETSLDDLISVEGVDEDCTDFADLGIEPGAGEIGLHFILTQPEAESGTISGSVDGTAFGPISNTEHGNANVLHFYVVVAGDGDSVVNDAETSVNGDQLTLSHICFGEEEESTPPSEEASTPASEGPSFEASQEGDTDAPSEPQTDALGTNGIASPADGAWLLVVALGVLLASIVVLTPARAKSRR